MNEAVIRHRIESGVSAIRARDIEGVMSLYAPDLVSFDVSPPLLRYEGIDGKRRTWQEILAAYSGLIGSEIAELNITAHGDPGVRPWHQSRKRDSGQRASQRLMVAL